MTKFVFTTARFYDQSQTFAVVETRLLRFLRGLRARRWDADRVPGELPAAKHDAFGQHDLHASQFLASADLKKAARRAAALIAARKAASNLDHLKAEDLRRLEPLKEQMRLVAPPREDRADTIAAELHNAFPWMTNANVQMWHDLRRSAHSGLPGIRFAPILLDGGPGIGKSAWARSVAAQLGMPDLLFDAGTEVASFGLIGSQRAWSNSRPGRLIESILQTRIANPLVIIDEVEKPGRVESSKGAVFSLEIALLSLLEPLSAASWTCPYYEIRCDMSWVCWILTSNDAAHLHPALRSRCRLIHVRDPTAAELAAFTSREGRRRGLSEAALGAALDTIDALTATTRRIDLRDVIRVLDRAVALENMPTHH